jgi:uncharacterized glyoxalase superfamily metalloenzyme YdcJ
VIEGPPAPPVPDPVAPDQLQGTRRADRVHRSGRGPGSHSARFGEIEQRGAALTPKGRALYDRLLNAARDELKDFPNEANAARYNALMVQHFSEFPGHL